MVQHHHLEYMKLDSRKNSIFLPPRPLPAFFTLNFFLSLFLFFLLLNHLNPSSFSLQLVKKGGELSGGG